MQNPWHELPQSDPFILAADAHLLRAFNATASPRHRYDLSLFPEPFFGSLEAPVVVLNLNPGWDPGDAEVHARDDFSAMARSSLSHSLQPYPFLHIQPSTSSPGGKWWRQRVARLIRDVGFESVAKGLACVQFMPYHSSEYSPSSPWLPSQAYSFNLVREAMARGAEIVIMRSKRLWFAAVPELEAYERTHIGANPRGPFVSPGNLKGSYSSIAERLVGLAKADTPMPTPIQAVLSINPPQGKPMILDPARQAFGSLCSALPSGDYVVVGSYENSGKLEIQRAFGSPKVVLVWGANGLRDNELTTRTEYATALGRWFPGFMPEKSKPQYSRTLSVSAAHLNAIVTERKSEIAAAILSVDQNR